MLLDHVMFRVEELERAIDWYERHLEYEQRGRWETETFTNVYLAPADQRDQDAMLELTYNHDDRTYTMGDAWDHVGIRVRDRNEAYEALTSSGANSYRTETAWGEAAYVEDPDGHRLELVEREYGSRFSLDHTQIRATDFDRTVGWYTHKFDYRVTRRCERGGSRRCFMRPKGVDRTAMSLSITDEGTVTNVGDAWGHLSVRVTDLIEECWPTLMRRGATDYRDPASCGPFEYEGRTTGIRHTSGPYAFTKDCDGRELELLQV